MICLSVPHVNDASQFSERLFHYLGSVMLSSPICYEVLLLVFVM